MWFAFFCWAVKRGGFADPAEVEATGGADEGPATMDTDASMVGTEREDESPGIVSWVDWETERARFEGKESACAIPAGRLRCPAAFVPSIELSRALFIVVVDEEVVLLRLTSSCSLLCLCIVGSNGVSCGLHARTDELLLPLVVSELMDPFATLFERGLSGGLADTGVLNAMSDRVAFVSAVLGFDGAGPTLPTGLNCTPPDLIPSHSLAVSANVSAWSTCEKKCARSLCSAGLNRISSSPAAGAPRRPERCRPSKSCVESIGGMRDAMSILGRGSSKGSSGE